MTEKAARLLEGEACGAGVKWIRAEGIAWMIGGAGLFGVHRAGKGYA